MDIEQSMRGALRDGEYVKERTAWIKAQRELAEIKLARERGELAPVEPIGVGVAALFAAVKQSGFAVPATVAPACVGKTAEEIRVIVYEGLRQAFEPLNEEYLERIVVAACEGAGQAGGAGSKGAPAVQRKRVGRRRKKVKQGIKREPGSVEDK